MKRFGIRQILPFLDLILVAIAYVAAFYLRFEGNIPLQHVSQFWQFFFLLPAGRVLCNFAWGVYRQAWNYVGMKEIEAIATSCFTGSALFSLALYLTNNASFPRSIVGIEVMLSLGLAFGLRYFLRYSHESQEQAAFPEDSSKTLIVGAGDAGEMLVRDMLRHPENGLFPVAFVDDDPRKKGMRIHGIGVLGDRSDISHLVKEKKINQIVVAIPTAPRRTQRELLEICTETSIKVRIIPGMHEIINGTVNVSHLREVEIEDLLGREPVVVDDSRLHSLLGGKNILVSGAGGSIGSELCRQIAAYRPAKLILLGHGENSIHAIEQELLLHFSERKIEIVPAIADIRDRVRIEKIFTQHSPQMVFHAAAHKHVPLMESNPVEAASNNSIGTRILAETAQNFGVDSFVLISTDKAVNPTSTMGMSKRLAELSILDLARMNKETKFTAVRFGNVLGSRGSVVPIFREQIARGGPLTITDPEMTRYFMTIPEAASLVLQSASLGYQGEVFMLEMGQPVKILDMAKNMIRLSGASEEDVKIVFTGTRPGEKLFEELRTDAEGVRATEHPLIFAVRSNNPYSREDWNHCLQRIREAIESQDEKTVHDLLSEIVALDLEKVATSDEK